MSNFFCLFIKISHLLAKFFYINLLDKQILCVVWPSPLHPHETTVPFLLSAKLCIFPTVILTTSINPFGTAVWPTWLHPQVTTDPSFLSAKLY